MLGLSSTGHWAVGSVVLGLGSTRQFKDRGSTRT